MALAVTVLCAALSLTTHAQTTRDLVHADASGTWIETLIGGDGSYQGNVSGSPRGNVIWQFNDANAIARSVCLADTMDETWIGWNDNSERLSYFQTTGNGTPIYEYSLLPGNPDTVAVASAEDTSLGALLVRGPWGTPVIVRGFNDTSGATPLWTYTFDTGFDAARIQSVDVSADGSIVIAAAYKIGQSQSLVVLLDGATGAEVNRLATTTYVNGVELNDDGSRAVLTEPDTARIIETSGMSDLFAFSLNGGGGFYRISRDGTVAAGGGYDYKAYRDTGPGWASVYCGTESQQWFGSGIGLSGDGGTMFLVSHNYATGYVDLTYRVIDLVAGVELARTTTSGSGELQDSVQRAEVSYHGHILAVVSWGTQDNCHPEVQVFDRSATLIGSIDTPGSPYCLDLSRDGRYLVAGAKHIHANIMGSGGDAYTYEVFIRGDLNFDDAVDLDDYNILAGCLNGPGVVVQPDCELADLDGDDDVDLADFAEFQAAFSG
ncbi:MAG: hypothetical protein KAY37_16520 [Phycisphaerae bacterium]|nr:hypothetical protein [Phycisphaerae bacterium]